MSCPGSALQGAIYDALLADASLAALVGTAIYDAIPAGALPETYAVLGDEIITDRSAVLCVATRHDFTISVLSTAPGYGQAKAVSAAIVNALITASLTLDEGHLVYLNFLRARAARVGTRKTRRIDITFRAMIETV